MASIAGCSERNRFATEPNPHSGLSQIEVERLHLRGLEWAVGEWVDEGEGPEIDHVTFEWSPDGNFLISTQDVTVKDTSVSSATEWIGWDPATSQVHSWSFVADGSVGENTWSNE